MCNALVMNLVNLSPLMKGRMWDYFTAHSIFWGYVLTGEDTNTQWGTTHGAAPLY